MKAVNRGVANARDWKPAENLPLAVAALRPAGRVLITMHRGPDGDALGSALALACALRDLGREVTVYNPDELPYNFRFLTGAAEVQKALPAGAAYDVTIVTDAGAFDRLGPDVPPPDRRGVLLNLDHHITTDPFGDVNYVDPEAASVGILAYKIIKGLGAPLSRGAAECIYASILADTGCFRYSSTDPECMRVAAELHRGGGGAVGDDGAGLRAAAARAHAPARRRAADAGGARQARHHHHHQRDGGADGERAGS